MTRALLVIGCGEPLFETALHAREAGFVIVIADARIQATEPSWARRFQPVLSDDVEALVALARTLERETELVGVYAAGNRGLPAAAAIGAATGAAAPRVSAVEQALDPARAAGAWKAARLPHAPSPASLEVNAFFRDGALQPAGIFVNEATAQGPTSFLPGGIDTDDAQAAYALLERGAHALGIEDGPVSAALAQPGGDLALVQVRPRFLDGLRTARMTPLVYGKSPFQAWFAALADVGGPFDEMPGEPRCVAGVRGPIHVTGSSQDEVASKLDAACSVSAVA